MLNLAGNANCDKYILAELREAGITPWNLAEPETREVPFSIYGVLGGNPLNEDEKRYMEKRGFLTSTAEHFCSFVFTRGWYYWVVQGFVPLAVAEELYEDPIGRKDIRVAGHCDRPHPKNWTRRHKVCGVQVVDMYHIDSQEGLNLFVVKILETGLC